MRIGEAAQMTRKLVRRPTMQDDREGILSLLRSRGLLIWVGSGTGIARLATGLLLVAAGGQLRRTAGGRGLRRPFGVGKP